MKKILTILAIFFACSNIANAKTYTLTDPTDIQIKKGDKIIIILKANPTTGYTWEMKLTTFTSPDCLKEKEFIYVPYKTKKGIVGSGGEYYYTLKAIAKGKAQVTGVYARTWEEPKSDLDYILNITVK